MTSLGSIGLDVASWITATVFEHDEGPWLDVVILSRELAPHAPVIASALEPIGGASFPERHLFEPYDVVIAFANGRGDLDNPVALLGWNGRPWHERPGMAFISHKSWSQLVRDGWYGGRRAADALAEFESWLRPA